MKHQFLWIIFLFNLVILMFGQEIDYTISKPDTLFIGQPFHMNVKIVSAKEDTIFTTRKDTLNIFQILSSKEKIIEVNEQQKETSLNIELAAFDTGDFTFPSLFFMLKGEQFSELSTDPFPIYVASVLQDSTNTIADIAPMMNIGLKVVDYILLFLTVIIVFFIIWFILKKLKKKPQVIAEEKIEIDNRPAFIKALELLASLKSKDLLNQGKTLEFYFEMAHILRFFLEQEYNFQALEMTTSEIKDNMQMITGKERTILLSFLNKSDQIKFAKGATTIAKAEADLVWLEEYFKDFEKKEYKKSEEKHA